MAGPAPSGEPELSSFVVEGTLWFALVSGGLCVATLMALSSLMLADTLHDLVSLPEPTEAVVEPLSP
jgi:hypothetical protein